MASRSTTPGRNGRGGSHATNLLPEKASFDAQNGSHLVNPFCCKRNSQSLGRGIWILEDEGQIPTYYRCRAFCSWAAIPIPQDYGQCNIQPVEYKTYGQRL